MKTLLSTIAIKIIENNFSDQSILICGSILKDEFIKLGYAQSLANEFAIDALKITLSTINKIK